MAVQAPFQCSPNAFPLDFQTTNNNSCWPADIVFKDDQIRDLLGQQQILANRAMISDPESDRTCNAAFGFTRKRNRDVQQLQIPIASKIPKLAMFDDDSRALGSAGTSTSGMAPQIDALIRLHNAKLRSGLDEIQKRHYAEIVRRFENQAAKKITEKDAEIEILRRKQAELESRLKQIAAEGQIWFTVARNSEALASNLKASLDQVLRRCADAAGGGGGSGRGVAEDAESCCYEDEGEDRKGRRLCRACRERDVSVLLLPCRHLCLCAECEPAADTCPICYAAKNTGLRVFMQ